MIFKYNKSRRSNYLVNIMFIYFSIISPILLLSASTFSSFHYYICLYILIYIYLSISISINIYTIISYNNCCNITFFSYRRNLKPFSSSACLLILNWTVRNGIRNGIYSITLFSPINSK